METVAIVLLGMNSSHKRFISSQYSFFLLDLFCSVLSKNKTWFVHGSYLKMSKDSDRTVTVGHGSPPEKEDILMEKQPSPLELSRVVWDKGFWG